MNKSLQILLIVFLIVGAVIMFALVWADARFELVRSAPHISHESMVDADTGLRAVVFPERIPQGFIDTVLEGNTWATRALNWTMPHEVALLSRTRVDDDDISLQFVINNRRLGPVIQQYVNEETNLPSTALFSWSPEGLQRQRRGLLKLDGEVHVDRAVMQNRDSRWSGARPRLHLPLEGGHMFELILDNRQGAAYILAGAYAVSQQLGQDALVNMALEALRDVDHLHATGDFLTDTDLGLNIRIECDPQGQENTPQAMAFFLEMLLTELRTSLQADYGVELTGAAEVDGFTVQGRYRLRRFDRFFL